MRQAPRDLWSLTPGGGAIDAGELAEAIETQVGSGDLDFRTRLLVRDSLDALAQFWGRERLAGWIDASDRRDTLRRLWQEELGEPGFPSVAWRVMIPTKPETILQFLRDLGTRVRGPAQLFVGGSAALILPRMLTRVTDDIDVVDEVPASIRGEHALLAELLRRYGLRLTHFQSHYLPAGWERRITSLGPFGEIEIHLVDPHDVFLSKLFSNRTKDLDDLRLLAPQLDKGRVVRQLAETAQALRGEPHMRAAAERNWYVIYGEPLP
jgi:hypothetical protein